MSYRRKPVAASDHWPRITAEQLHLVREPLRWQLDLGQRVQPKQLDSALRSEALGPRDAAWQPPGWLRPHQLDAAQRICGCIDLFRGALLADAVGLGKTYVALAIATRYRRTTAVVPAALASQWARVSNKLGVEISLTTHEALSRGSYLPPADLIIVDEAHRFRNPNANRYDALARSVGHSHLLLLTATPVVNRGADLVHLLRLFASDSTFAVLGVASLDHALAERAYEALAYATAPTIVARSPDSLRNLTDALPRVTDRSVLRPASAHRRTLATLLRIIDTLQFPSVVDAQESALLRMHMLHRLASSTTACRETARRHLAYTERALSAAERGEALSRASARQIFRTVDELQLEFGDVRGADVAVTVDPAALNRERQRLALLLRTLNGANGSSPKANALAQVLQLRAGKKTIVFTTAVATAIDLARHLRWREIAVVGAGNAWIASGRIPVDEALGLFAPKARDCPDPPRSARVTTLIATDLASEGLDLQDADAVVHYDLPWTPLKLEQRVGRVARLGSEHHSAEVHWFAPPAAIERRLGIEARIAEKARYQLGLTVVATSRVGRARVVNELLNVRERLGHCHYPRGIPGPRYAVVKGPLCAIIALRWTLGNTGVPELVALQGYPPREMHNYDDVDDTLSQLCSAKESESAPPAALVDGILAIVRSRLASFDRGAINHSSRRIARRVLARAHTAGRQRDAQLLSTLDAVLNRVDTGLPIGAERTLETLLSASVSHEAFQGWIQEQPERRPGRAGFYITAAVFGDGTESC